MSTSVFIEVLLRSVLGFYRAADQNYYSAFPFLESRRSHSAVKKFRPNPRPLAVLRQVQLVDLLPNSQEGPVSE